jgi:hypothetical protein
VVDVEPGRATVLELDAVSLNEDSHVVLILVPFFRSELIVREFVNAAARLRAPVSVAPGAAGHMLSFQILCSGLFERSRDLTMRKVNAFATIIMCRMIP